MINYESELIVATFQLDPEILVAGVGPLASYKLATSYGLLGFLSRLIRPEFARNSFLLLALLLAGLRSSVAACSSVVVAA